MYVRVEQGRKGCDYGSGLLSYDINKGRVVIGEGKEGIDHVGWVLIWVMIG